MWKRQKISRFEAILIIAIIAMTAFFVVLALKWPAASIAHRDDALMANTAESVAVINSDNGQDCVVNDCDEKNCPHRQGNAYVGYFDPSTNTIVAQKPRGYNEEKRIRLDGKTYRGDIGTLVIEARSENGTVAISWVKGGNG